MEQAMIGPSPNPLILSYLKYAISSQVRQKIVQLSSMSKSNGLALQVVNITLSLPRWCLIPVCSQPSAR